MGADAGQATTDTPTRRAQRSTGRHVVVTCGAQARTERKSTNASRWKCTVTAKAGPARQAVRTATSCGCAGPPRRTRSTRGRSCCLLAIHCNMQERTCSLYMHGVRWRCWVLKPLQGPTMCWLEMQTGLCRYCVCGRRRTVRGGVVPAVAHGLHVAVTHEVRERVAQRDDVHIAQQHLQRACQAVTTAASLAFRGDCSMEQAMSAEHGGVHVPSSTCAYVSQLPWQQVAHNTCSADADVDSLYVAQQLTQHNLQRVTTTCFPRLCGSTSPFLCDFFFGGDCTTMHASQSLSQALCRCCQVQAPQQCATSAWCWLDGMLGHSCGAPHSQAPGSGAGCGTSGRRPRGFRPQPPATLGSARQAPTLLDAL